MTEVSQSPEANSREIDATWSDAASTQVLGLYEGKIRKECSVRFREIATQTCVRRILDQGSIAAEAYYERHTHDCMTNSSLAKVLGLDRVTLRRWTKDGKGSVNPLLFFAFFVADQENLIQEWTRGSIDESVLALLDDAYKSFFADKPKHPSPDRLALRFIAYCLCQKRSRVRLLGRESDREATFVEYLETYFKHDELEIRTHRKRLAEILEGYCYLALVVLNSVPPRVLRHVLEG